MIKKLLFNIHMAELTDSQYPLAEPFQRKRLTRRVLVHQQTDHRTPCVRNSNLQLFG